MRCMYHGLKFDPTGQVHPDPGPGQHPEEARRAQLPGGRARPPGVDLDGRAGDRRSGEDPRLPTCAIRTGAASRTTCTTSELPADRRQPLRLRAPRLRAHEDARRLGGVRLQVEADRDRAPRGRLPRRALAHGRGRAAVPQESRATAGKVDRRNIARMYVPGIFFMETLFSPAGGGAEKATSRARSSTATASSSPRRRPLDALLLGLPARLRPRQPDIALR